MNLSRQPKIESGAVQDLAERVVSKRRRLSLTSLHWCLDPDRLQSRPADTDDQNDTQSAPSTRITDSCLKRFL